jgi:hypothetical protein
MSPFKGFSENGESKSDEDFNNAQNAPGYGSGSDSAPVSGLQKELIAVDEVLARKMALVNGAIDEIGMTPFQWKLFFLNGFGYAVDSVCTIPSPIPTMLSADVDVDSSSSSVNPLRSQP